MKKWRIVAVLLLCLTLAGVTACSPFGGGEEETSQQLVEVVRGDMVVSVTATGSLSLPRHRRMTFSSSGTIAQVNVEQGDRVTKDEVLAKLDSTTLEQAVKTSERAVQTAELAVQAAGLAVQTAETGMKTGELAVKSAEIDLEQATDNYRRITYPYTYRTWVLDIPTSMAAIEDAQREVNEALEVMQELGLSREQYSWQQYWDVWHQLEQAQDNLEEARANLTRGYGEDVFGSGIVPIESYWTLKTAQLGVDKAQLALDTAENNLNNLKDSLDTAKNNLDNAKINLDIAKDDLDRVKDELEKTVILAPFDGVIARVNVEEGDVLSSMDYATKIIIELIDPTTMELKVGVDEIDIPGVELNQGVTIELDALPALPLEGKVTYICPLPTVESGVVLYNVTIGFDVPEGGRLKAGMSATADIIIDERSNVLLVPSRAVKQDIQGRQVVEVMVDDQIQERPVVTGISDGYQTEIISGLDEGETVVIVVRATTTPSGPGGFPFGG